MTLDEVVEFVRTLDGTLVLQPVEGSRAPELAWGDSFFYYSPTGEDPTSTQPFATIVTKNYPDDEGSHLERPDAFRVNVWAGKEQFVARLGREPRENLGEVEVGDDVVFAHPVYGSAGWLCVVNPGRRTRDDVHQLIRLAHEAARHRWDKRRIED